MDAPLIDTDALKHLADAWPLVLVWLELRLIPHLRRGVRLLEATARKVGVPPEVIAGDLPPEETPPAVPAIPVEQIGRAHV